MADAPFAAKKMKRERGEVRKIRTEMSYGRYMAYDTLFDLPIS